MRVILLRLMVAYEGLFKILHYDFNKNLISTSAFLSELGQRRVKEVAVLLLGSPNVVLMF